LAACLFFVLAWHEANVWSLNAWCYSGWVGLPKYAGQLDAVGRAAEIDFWGMALSFVAGCFLAAYCLWVFRNIYCSLR